jgi:hypothetical protein
MTAAILRPLAVTALLTAAACAGAPPAPPQGEVAWGPARAARPNRILVLSATCGSVEFHCPREYVETVDAIVRSGLEFDGYHLVETRDLLAKTRARQETLDTAVSHEHATSTGVHDGPLVPRAEDTGTVDRSSESEHRTVVLDGSVFEDLAVGERKAVLAEAGADGVVTVRLVVGAEMGMWNPDQGIEVLIKLAVADGDVMAWASRCTSRSGAFQTANAALENAARCAVAGARR